MSEAVQIVIINGIVTIVTVFLGRWLSHREHKRTADDVAEIKIAVNGGNKSD